MLTKPATRVGGRPANQPPVIFICYRREDTEEFAAMVNLKLEPHFGERANVFWDHGDIPYGDDFPQKIRGALADSAALVAIIGSQWLNARDKEGAGGRRLDNEKDYVRLEIASALTAGVPVIPVIIGDATMPAEEDLPTDLQPLATKNALFIRSVKHFDRDVKDLIEELEKRLPPIPEPPIPEPPKEHDIFDVLDEHAGETLNPVEEIFGRLGNLSPRLLQVAAIIVFIIIIILLFWHYVV